MGDEDEETNTVTILNVAEVATWLKLSKSQVYAISRTFSRDGKKISNPLPCLRINSNIRFVKEDIEEWLKSVKTPRGDR